MIISGIRSVCTRLIILVFILSAIGCIKEDFDSAKFDGSLDLKSGLAIPVGFSHLTFEEYLTDTIPGEALRTANDGFLSLYYFAPIDSGVMEDIISINDANAAKSILNLTGSAIFLNTPGSVFFLTDSLNIPIESTHTAARIDSISLRSGSIQVEINSTNLTGSVVIEINGLRQNGQPFSTTRNLADPDFILPLSGYTIIPSQDISGNNILKCSISVSLQSPSGPVNPGNSIISLQANLAALAYETIYGNFGGFNIDFPAQTIPTPFFNQLTGGEIFFADPKFKLFFSNSAGVPFGIYFRRIDAIDRINISHPLSGPGIPVAGNPEIINFPSLAQIGQIITDSLIIDRTNSNLPDFLATSPDSISIEASAEIVSLTPPATTFIRYDSEYNISAAIELPLWGKADFLILLDTMEFDYLSSALPPPDEIERLLVRISITNSFPVEASPQVYLLDAGRAVIDSLFFGTERVEGAIDENGDGKADPFNQAPFDIDLPRAKIDNLFSARYLLIRARIMTTDYPVIDVRLYSTYFLDFDIGLIASLKIKTAK